MEAIFFLKKRLYAWLVWLPFRSRRSFLSTPKNKSPQKKKAKTIINRVMLNHSRTIKVFCEAMSTSAWQTSSTNSRLAEVLIYLDEVNAIKMHEWVCPRGNSGEAMRLHFWFKGCTTCLEQTSSVGGRNWNKTIHCLCKRAKKCFLLPRREVTERGNGKPGTRNRSLGMSLQKEKGKQKGLLRAFKFTGKRNNILEIPSYFDFCMLYNFIELM